MSTTTQRHPSLHGKAVLVTGAASGVGAALARRLAASGASIVGIDLQAARLADSMAQLREHGVQAHSGRRHGRGRPLGAGAAAKCRGRRTRRPAAARNFLVLT